MSGEAPPDEEPRTDPPDDDPTVPEQPELDPENPEDEPGNDSPAGRSYELQDTVETVNIAGQSPPVRDSTEVSIDGTRLDAVSHVKFSGEGRQKQYLSAAGSGGSGGGDAADDSTDDDSESSDDEGSTSAGSGSGDDTRTPPLTITISCRLGHETFETLEALREIEEPFNATVGDFSLDKMELADLQRGLSGDQPYTYNATVKIREYREKTIQIPVSSGGDGSTDGSGEVPGGVGDTTEDWIEEGSGGVSDPQTDYETVEVTDSRETIEVGDGETLENQLYDLQGGSVQIVATGSDWAIRNIGIRGQHPGGHFVFHVSVPDADGNALIDNVYLADGQQPRTTGGGIFARAQGDDAHQGVITVRRANIGQMVSNGLYASGPATQGNSGKVDVQNSLFYSNNIANLRLGSRDDRTSYVRNVVTAVDSNAIPPCGQDCTSPGATRSRGLWTWHGETTVMNSDIAGDIETRDGGSHTFEDTNRGSDAERRTPAGVPLNAEAAAGGDA